jgi:hypothetical protein
MKKYGSVTVFLPEIFFPCVDVRVEMHKPDRASFLGKSAQQRQCYRVFAAERRQM